MQVYKTEKLTYFYPDSKIPALDRINVEISKGEVILLAGHSGCGKSTLLKLFAGLVPAFYGGTVSGNAFFGETDILKRSKSLAPDVGILFQDPEKQLVTARVEREIALPMENMGVAYGEAKKRLMEVLHAAGIKELEDKRIETLSSGQKQKVALASILGMNPEVLLLDEPTSQIDPASSEELLNTVRKIAEDDGKTVIMAEQKIEKCLHFTDRVIAMHEGRIVFDGGTDKYCKWAYDTGFKFVPVIPRLFAALNPDKTPVTVREGRKVLAKMLDNKDICFRACSKPLTMDGRETECRESAVEVEKLYFSYYGSGSALRNINLRINKGEFAAILGRNGAGKTTLLKNINGLLMPQNGDVRINGVSTRGKSIYDIAQKIAYLGQNPDDYLFSDTVRDEVLFTLNNFGRVWDEKTTELVSKLGIEKVKDKNPRDLSSGQKQRTALASIMCILQGIVLLDEPTRGMDYINKDRLGEILLDLKSRGTTIILVTHDVDFAAEYSDRIIIMSDGEITADGLKEEVLSNNIYYSSQINKLFRGMGDLVTYKQAEEWLLRIWEERGVFC